MKVLCIMCQNIFDVKSGGGQGAKRNYDAIKNSMCGEDTVYTCIISENLVFEENERELYIPGLKNNIERALAALQSRKCCKKSYEKKIWNFVKKIEPDIIYLDTSKLGKYAKYIKKNHKCSVLVFFHNVESDYSLNFVKNMGYQYLLAYLASLKNEKTAVKYADQLICLNERDKRRIEKVYGRSPESIIPVSLPDKFEKERLNIDLNNGILFVGSLFPPNYQGIMWFINEVMSKLPEEKLTIVGKDFEKRKSELERKNVRVIGTVVNLDSYYYTYPIIVMPIQYGSGMKVKTVEAMMYGKVILATDEALEGYDITEKEGVLRCNTAEEFIDAIRKIMSGNTNFVNDKVRNIFLNRYEYKVTNKQFGELINELRKK